MPSQETHIIGQVGAAVIIRPRKGTYAVRILTEVSSRFPESLQTNSAIP
jgi:hypothetical protein